MKIRLINDKTIEKAVTTFDNNAMGVEKRVNRKFRAIGSHDHDQGAQATQVVNGETEN